MTTSDGSDDNDVQLDVSVHPCCWVVSCPVVHCGICPYQTVVTLARDEAIRHDTALCGSRVSHRPYRDLGTVETSTFCCLVCVDSNLGTIFPGFGCDRRRAEQIAHELKTRQKYDSSTMAARRRHDNERANDEQVDARMREVDRKLGLILQHLQIDGETAPANNSINGRC